MLDSNAVSQTDSIAKHFLFQLAALLRLKRQSRRGARQQSPDASFKRNAAICTSFMYSESGMASKSASVNSATGLVFQLLTSLASFLTAAGNTGGGASDVDA